MTSAVQSTSIHYQLPESIKKRLEQENRPLRVEILECEGGQGHKMSAQAVQKVIEEHFGLGKISFTHFDAGGELIPDPLGKATLGTFTLVDFHNHCARRGWTRLIGAITEVGKKIHRFTAPFSERSLRKRYERLDQKGEAPDLIISATPLINSSLLKSVKDKNIPVFVVSTDGDNALFSHNWTKTKLGPYRYGIPYNSLEIAEKVNRAVDPSKIRGVGYPVRPEFSKQYSTDECDAFRAGLGIEKESKVIGVMMGGLGGCVTKKYVNKILKSNQKREWKHQDLHFVIFCGRNTSMISELKKMAKKNNLELVSKSIGGQTGRSEIKFKDPSTGMILSILGFTDEIYQYMALSSCWVTKSGSSTFNECLSLSTPMLLDRTDVPLPWEKLNFELAKTYRFGNELTKIDQLVPRLNSMLESQNNENFRSAMADYRMKRSQQQEFARNVVNVTEELLLEAEALKSSAENKNPPPVIHQARLKRVLNFSGKKMLTLAKKVYKTVMDILLSPFMWWANQFVNSIFFRSFNISKTMQRRERSRLIHEGAQPIEGGERPLISPASKRPIDALYLTSSSPKRTGNAVIFVRNSHYQKFSPANYKHLLEDGADVVLFNPTQNNCETMAADLKEVVRELLQKKPNQKFVLNGYCVGGHVAAAVAGEIAEGKVSGIGPMSLPVIVDRGYGNGHAVAQKVSVFARLSFFKSYLDNRCNVKEGAKVTNHAGKMLFITPRLGDDQLIHSKKNMKNLMLDIRDSHTKGENQVIEIENGDHWTAWPLKVHNEVKKFLHDQGVLGDGYREVTVADLGGEKEYKRKLAVPWRRRNLIPILVS